MVSNFKSEDILFFLWFSVCRYLAGFIEKMKRMKAFVNELMRDASDATRRQKVIGITYVPIQFSFSSLFLSEREMERGVSTRVEKAEE